MEVLVFVSALTTLIWTKDGRQGGGIGERWGRPDKNNDGREIERMGERDLLIASASVFQRAAPQRLYRLISSPPFSQSHFQKRTSYIIKHSTWYFEENFLRHVSSKFCCKSSALSKSPDVKLSPQVSSRADLNSQQEVDLNSQHRKQRKDLERDIRFSMISCEIWSSAVKNWPCMTGNRQRRGRYVGFMQSSWLYPDFTS